MSVATGDVRPEKRIEQNPFDLDSWNMLLRESQKKKISETRSFYERLVTQFPNAGRYWKSYIEAEIKEKNLEAVERIFQRCLVKVLNIDLWKAYLNYVRETKGHLPSFREKMAQAYDFALEKVGMDALSHTIYVDYISFLKGVQAVGSYAENQKITAVRKIYQRAIVTPLLNIEQLWNDYCNYEKSINPTLADKLISERSRDYQNARRVSKTMENTVRGIHRNMISVPPRGTLTEMKQVDHWKKYISWEKTNPLATDDYHLYTKRVIYAYEQALLCLGYYPDFWYEAALFMTEAARNMAEKGDVRSSAQLLEEVGSLYERATTTLLRKNMLIHFAYADFEEERGRYEKVHDIYKKFLNQHDLNPTLAYIQYMKFARRTEGVATARTIFKRAREDPRSNWQVYVFSALMEYYCSKDPSVAYKIFDLGLNKFTEKSDYALAFADFVKHLNEDSNTRVLFERISKKTQEVWDHYLEFECLVGDLTSINKVDGRRRKLFDSEYVNCQALFLVDRYRFMNLFPMSSDDVKKMGYPKWALRHFASLSGGAVVGGSGVQVTVKSEPESSSVNGTSSSKLRNKNITAGNNTIIVTDNADKKPAIEQAAYPQPDTSQMIPFKPRIITTSSYHPVPGGIFPPPPAVSHLLSILPPPVCFNGPFVGVDVLMEKFGNFSIPDEIAVPSGEPIANGPLHPKLERVKTDFIASVENTPDPMLIVQQEQASRRALPPGADPDDDFNNMMSRGGRPVQPSTDIYRQRQQNKRMKFA